MVLLKCSGYSLTSSLILCGGKNIQTEPLLRSIHFLPVLLNFDWLSGDLFSVSVSVILRLDIPFQGLNFILLVIFI